MAKETKITKDMGIGEVVQKHPEAFEVFSRHGLHCVGCVIAQFENIEQGAVGHGIDADKLVEDLNKAIKKKK